MEKEVSYDTLMNIFSSHYDLEAGKNDQAKTYQRYFFNS